jgi:hypothetical protein
MVQGYSRSVPGLPLSASRARILAGKRDFSMLRRLAR